MRQVSLGPDAVFHRYHTPRWAHVPLSGAGAALGGGRFNRPGLEALYLSRSPQTALEEYGQGASITPPGTLAAYLVTLSHVVDLSDGYEPGIWAPPWGDWHCAWRYIARIERREPPSWLLADEVIAGGHSGILFPSIRHPGGVNLVVYLANLRDEDKLTVHDPDGRLPRDGSSWS